MKKLSIGIAIGIILGIVLVLLGQDYLMTKKRVVGIEQFLNNAIQAQQKQPQPKIEEKK